jgi:hypothetical protein
MSRIYPYIACLLLAIALGWSIKSHIEMKQQYKKLQYSVIAFNKANQESVKVITEIREKIKYVKDPCNCYNVRIPDAIIDRVHHNK